MWFHKHIPTLRLHCVFEKGPELATFAELFDSVYSNATIYKWAMKFEV